MRARVCGFVAIVLCVFAHGAWAETQPYNQVTMPSGPLSGQPIDTRQKRSVRILPEGQEGKFGAHSGDVVIANFYHEGKFWTARFPKDAVQDVYFQKDVFPAAVPAAHSQIRFQLKPDHEVQLFPPDGGEPPRRAKISDVIYSVEAVPMQGDAFNIIRGAMNQYGLAFRVMSQQESYYKIVYSTGQHVEQVRLRISDSEKQKMLTNALIRSHRSGMGEMYNTICRSCNTEAFHLIDTSVRIPWVRIPATGLEVLPILPRTYLWLRGIIPAKEWLGNSTPPVEREFAHFKDLPEFAERLALDQVRIPAEAAQFRQWAAQNAKRCAFGYLKTKSP